MKTFKQIVFKVPEYYLIALVLISSFSAGINFSFMAFGVVAILILQLVFKNRVFGIILASIFILINLYMLAAVSSEFNEFAVINAEAQQLRAGGLLFFIFNSFIAGTMLVKYIQKEDSPQLANCT